MGGPAFFCLFLHCSCHFTSGNQTQHFLLGDGSNLYRFLRNKYILFRASKVFLHAQLAEPHIQLLQSAGASEEQLTVPSHSLSQTLHLEVGGTVDALMTAGAPVSPSQQGWDGAGTRLLSSPYLQHAWECSAGPCTRCLTTASLQMLHSGTGLHPEHPLLERKTTIASALWQRRTQGEMVWCRRGGLGGWGQLSPLPLSPLVSATNSNTKKHPVSAVVTSSPQLRNLEPYCLI